MVSPDKDRLARTETVTSGLNGVPTSNNVQALRPGDAVISDGLADRPAKPLDVAALAAAIGEIAPRLVSDPDAAGRTILEAVIRLCGCGSAGLSLVEPGSDALVWSRVAGLVAGPLTGPLAGLSADRAGLRLPEDRDATRRCHDANATLLVSRPFAGLIEDADAPPLEGLFTPLRDGAGHGLGVLWALHHDVTARFDREDARILEQLAGLLALSLNTPGAARGRSAARPAPRVRWSVEAANPVIRKLQGFVPLTAAERDDLHHLTEDAVTVAARTDLLRADDRPGGIVLMMEGLACRTRRLGPDRRQSTAYLLPGDSCDLDVAPTGPDETIMSLTEGRVVRLDRPTVLDLTRNHPGIAAALRMTALVDEATLREWLIGLGSRGPLERIAHLLCELRERSEAVGLVGAAGLPLPLRHTDLAEATGLPVVHVTRVIHDLDGRGLLDQADGKLIVRDPDRLKALAGFTGAYLHPEGRRPRR